MRCHLVIEQFRGRRMMSAKQQDLANRIVRYLENSGDELSGGVEYDSAPGDWDY